MELEDNPSLYSYCIPIDDGAAPNPYWGICTLTICKPVIRRVAKVGDWVVGIGSKNSPIGDISNHVVYAMKITKVISLQQYDTFCEKNYPNKRPNWYSRKFIIRVGDCIYDFSDESNPKIRKSVHTKKNKEKDLSGKNALISDHFYYFGDKPIPLPENLNAIIKEGQGHKSTSNKPYINDFIDWIENLSYEINSINGEPQLKEEIMKIEDVCLMCSNGHYDEAIKDEEIGLDKC